MCGDNCQQGPQLSLIDIKLRQRYTRGLFPKNEEANMFEFYSTALFDQKKIT